MNNNYFEYKGVKYGIGTKVLAHRYRDEVEMVFCGWQSYGSFCCGKDGLLCGGISVNDVATKIIKIIEPVYWTPPEQKRHPKKGNIFTRTGSGSYQHSDEVTAGLIWYIIVMVVACLFKNYWTIWIVATIIFFSWKNKL